MTKTNIKEWAAFYQELLVDKYDQFCKLFNKGEEPNYSEFVKFVWFNTTKVKNVRNGKLEAKINTGV